jgi:drug/metabolite transporter (DMT)-like permease
MAKLSPHLYGTLITTLGVIILSPDGLLIRLIDVEGWTVLFWRGLFFAAGVWGFYILRHGRTSIDLLMAIGKRGVLAALLFTLSTIFFVLAISNTSVANTLVIVATAPLWAAILSRIFLNERIAPLTWIAILICVGGISIIFIGSLGGGSRLGDIYALICAFGLAGQITTVRHAKDKDMVPSLGLSGLMVAAIAFPLSDPGSVTAEGFAYLVLLGLFILPLAFSLITIGPRYIPAPEVSLLMLLESILGPLWVWLVLNEIPQNETLIGGTLVITTLIFHSGLSYWRKKDT